MMQLRGRLGYGVATNVYGSGMLVGDSFDTLAEAEQFAASKLSGGAVICRWSDGRWRNLGNPISAERVDALRQERIDRLMQGKQ